MSTRVLVVTECNYGATRQGFKEASPRMAGAERQARLRAAPPNGIWPVKLPAGCA